MKPVEPTRPVALVPDQLKALWKEVEAKRLTYDEFVQEQNRLTDDLKRVWAAALSLEGHSDLTQSLLSETGLYSGCADLAEVERRCRAGVTAVKQEWEASFRPGDNRTVEEFYNQSRAYVYDLMWWHTLTDDLSPLAYVLALQFAQAHACRTHLDFGSGSGAGSILFARNGFDVALADISSSMLEFSRWRLALRGVTAKFFDLKTDKLPSAAFDVITAMDVFEHLVDPVSVATDLATALRPGGLLIGRFTPSPDATHPQHIVLDFKPTFDRMKELGLVEVWRDEWLWGHQAFQKRS
jgi:mycofactocin glycosyltransferase